MPDRRPRERRWLRTIPWFSASLLTLLILVALAAPWLTPHDPRQQDLLMSFLPPVWTGAGEVAHPFGTDELGRDVLANILFGLRVSLLVGFGSVAISVLVGTPLGLWAGYRGGRVDTLLMRLVDVQLSLPIILVALGVLAVWGAGLWKVILVIGLVGWAEVARLVRGSVLAERSREYVTAAEALAAGVPRILFRHALPNVLNALLVLVSVMMPRFIILEATLSFLGLGVAIDTPSLGLAVSRGYEYLFSGSWWTSTLPGLALLLLVLAVNLLGDWLRDALDPRAA